MNKSKKNYIFYIIQSLENKMNILFHFGKENQ